MSAKNVEKAFVSVATDVIKKIDSGVIDPHTYPGIKLGPLYIQSNPEAAKLQQQNVVLTADKPNKESGGGCPC